jgi:ribosomal protein L11 methyltransferase
MRELIFYCQGEQADLATDALMQAGALSASVEDADLDTPEEQPIYGEPGSDAASHAWQASRVLALLADGVDPSQVMQQAQQLVAFTLDADWQTREVPDQDWVRLTQSQFGPIAVGNRLLIVPSWHHAEKTAAETETDRVTLSLDPGLAFGTGSHPTTHLCLQWLASEMPQDAQLLDYGCGSGILAIAARLFGAGQTWAVDIDEQAVESTLYNATVNAVTLSAALPDGLPDGQFDVVVANILSNPLKVLAPMLSKRVKPGGSLVLSGVLERQAEEVAAFYAPWVNLTIWQSLDGWVCLAGQLETEPTP